MLEVGDTAPGNVGQPHTSTFDLVSAASALQLACDLRDLRHTAGGHRMTGRPWEHDGCGAGAPCVCNPTGAVQWCEVFAEATLPDKLRARQND
jgi:hypothetical protein